MTRRKIFTLFTALLITFFLVSEINAKDKKTKKKKDNATISTFVDITSKSKWEELLKKAKKEKKPIILDFTGSDWCHWCVKLDKEVFNKEEFKKAAKEKFILAKVDIYRKKKMPEDEKKFKNKLVKDYGVKGFPTVLILDAKGKKIAKTGYRQGGPEKYLEHLEELVKKLS